MVVVVVPTCGANWSMRLNSVVHCVVQDMCSCSCCCQQLNSIGFSRTTCYCVFVCCTSLKKIAPQNGRSHGSSSTSQCRHFRADSCCRRLQEIALQMSSIARSAMLECAVVDSWVIEMVVLHSNRTGGNR